jgi:hypothetical protein
VAANFFKEIRTNYKIRVKLIRINQRIILNRAYKKVAVTLLKEASKIQVKLIKFKIRVKLIRVISKNYSNRIVKKEAVSLFKETKTNCKIRVK